MAHSPPDCPDHELNVWCGLYGDPDDIVPCPPRHYGRMRDPLRYTRYAARLTRYATAMACAGIGAGIFAAAYGAGAWHAHRTARRQEQG
jgi:hypothetical protein